MTRAQALKEAQKLYGPNAFARFNRRALTRAKRAELPPMKELPDAQRWLKFTDRYEIGYSTEWANHIRAGGDTWQEAIDKARGDLIARKG